MPDIDQYTSAEIAVALLEAARHQANIVADTEVLFSAMPMSPGLTDTLRKMRAKAEMLGKAHQLYKKMAQDEQAEKIPKGKKQRWTDFAKAAVL